MKSGTQIISKAAQSKARKVILLVDDDAVFRKATVMKLKAYGYDVVTAEDGSAAVSAIGKRKPDLVLLDINFPPDVAHGGGLAWDGFVILRWLRRTHEETGDVPVIAVTAGNLNLYREHCKAAGIVDLLANSTSDPDGNPRAFQSFDATSTQGARKMRLTGPWRVRAT